MTGKQQKKWTNNEHLFTKNKYEVRLINILLFFCKKYDNI